MTEGDPILWSIARLTVVLALALAPGRASAQGLDVSIEAVGRLSHLPRSLNIGNALGGGGRAGLQLSNRLLLELEHTTADVALQPMQQAGALSFTAVLHSEIALRAALVSKYGPVDVIAGVGPAYTYFSHLHITPDDAAGANASLGLRYSPTAYSSIRVDGGITHMLARSGQAAATVPSLRIGFGLRICVLPRLEEE